MTAKAYSYVRFSTPEQLKGDSLRRQLELSQQYAQEHGLILDDSLNLRDLGLSGFHGTHRAKGALGQFLKLVEAGKIPKGSSLILEELDRLTRQELLEAVHLFTGLLVAGISIHSIVDGMIYTPESFDFGQMVISAMKLSQGHEESRKKSERLKAAWSEKRDKATNGERKLTARAVNWLQLSKDNTTFSLIAERASIIRQIFEWKLAGKGSIAIEQSLNARKDLPWIPKNGWRKSYIQKILTNPAVIGEYQPHKLIQGKRQPVGDPIPDYYPPAIPNELFHQVQELIHANVHKGGRTGKVNNLFTHIAKCGYCGGPMAFVDKGALPKGGCYLVCDTSRRGIGCIKTSIRYEEIERLVLTYCRGLRPQDLLSDDATELAILQGKLAATEADLSKASIQIENLTDSIAETREKTVRKVLEKRLSETLAASASLEAETKRLKREIDTVSRSSDSLQASIESLNELLRFLSTETGDELLSMKLRLRQELRQLIKRIDVYPEGSPRYTPGRVEETVSAILEAYPDLDGSTELERVRSDLLRRVANPKEYRSYNVHFATGSIRTLSPAKVSVLGLEFDQETGSVRSQYVDKNGRITVDEFDS